MVVSSPNLWFSLSDFPVEDRLEIWRDFNAGSFDIDLGFFQEEELYADVCAYDLGQTYFGVYTHSKLEIRANQNRSSLGDNEMLVLGMHRSGYGKGLINGTRFEMAPSFLTLYDASQSLQLESTGVEYLEFMVPYSAIGYDPSRHPSFVNVGINSPLGVLLGNNLTMLAEEFPYLTRKDMHVWSDGFLGLLNGAIQGELREDTTKTRFSAAREVAIRRYIEKNLRNPDLTAQALCNAVGVSRAVLYRTFLEDGGVHRLIQKKRLVAARNDLAQSEPRRGLVKAVANKWTFSDPAHFSRLYREEFGEAPSETIGSAMRSGDEGLSDRSVARKGAAQRRTAFTLGRKTIVS